MICFVCGCTNFPTRSQQVWRSAIDYDYPSDPVGTDAFQANLDAFTGSVSHPDTAATLLQNGDEAYPVMIALIERATTRVFLETYIVENDETTDSFFDALRAAAGRGVEVRVLVDAAGFQRGMLAHLGELTASGVQARVFNPFFLSWTILRANNRDHRKILVVDGHHAVLGGINLSDRQTGDGRTGWRDTAMLVSGPVSHDVERVFLESWEQAGRGFVGKSLPLTFLNPIKGFVEAPFAPAAPDRTACPVHVEGGAAPCEAPAEYHSEQACVRVVASSPTARNSPTYDLAILGIQAARERVDVACAYFVPPENLLRAILRAARRGVKVRLLLPGVTDVRWVREIGMRFYGALLQAGVEIYEWPHPILHAKTMVVDGRWLVVGSANMDSRSYFLNYEACLAVDDAVLAEEAHRQFALDIGEARQYTMEDWHRRGIRQKWRERLLTPLAGQF